MWKREQHALTQRGQWWDLERELREENYSQNVEVYLNKK